MGVACKTILLVEDEAIIAMAERRQLESEGYRVVHAFSGERAVELVDAGGQTVDLILMDIDLGGGMDGTEAARVILERRDLPVLFLSSHIERELVAKTESITNYGYVVKNSSFTVLDASIKMAFKLFDATRKIDEQRMWNEAAYEEMQVANDNLIKTQRELEESEETFRTLFEKAPMGIAYHRMVYDDAGRPSDYLILDANVSYIRLTGADPRGKLVTEAFPGIERDPFDWIGTYGRVAMSGESLSLRQPMSLNGRWYDIVAFRNKPDHFVVSFFEISEQKRAEQSLELERTRLRNVIDGANVGTWEVEVRTGRSSVDAKSLELLGYAEGELECANLDAWMSLKHPDDEAGARAALSRHIDGHTPHYQYESRMRRKDGSWAWILARGKVIERDAEGKALRMFGTHQDVTERREAEEALRSSEERFRSYFELPFVGITVSMPDRGWILVNPGFCAMLGFSACELLGKNWAEFTHPDDLAENIRLSDKLISGELDNYSMVKRFRRKDGGYVWASLSGGCVRNADGTARYLVAITQDIHERKLAEETLKTLLA